MRLVQVEAPEGQGEAIAQVAFEVGISQVSIKQQRIRRPYQSAFGNEVVEVAVATPTARAFVDAVTAAPFFNKQDYAVIVRDARSILSRERLSQLTLPWVAPACDVAAELWQMSHITVGFVGRMFIAALLLAYGVVQNQLLTMLAGMLFMPFLPLLLATSFGVCTRQWGLARQGLLALLVGLGTAVLGGATVAWLVRQPVQFEQFGQPLPSFLISLVVGVAAGLATADDAGHRQMIGLAATSQVAVLAVWFGLVLVVGLPPEQSGAFVQRVLILGSNVTTIIGAAIVTYLCIGMRGHSLRRPVQRHTALAK